MNVRIFNESKTQQVYEPNLNLGWLKEDRMVTAHHAATPVIEQKSHLELLKEYPETGGCDMREIIDVPFAPARDAYDDYEDIMVFVPFSNEQILSRGKELRLNEIQQRLNALSQDLIQALAGEEVPNLGLRKTEFKALHNELRILEGKTPRIG